MIFNNIVQTIGNTPVIELNSNFVPNGKRLFLKLEFFNPTFSIKDRTALGLVRDAMAQGKLSVGGTIIESTSGNLGKSLAMLGATYGFKVILVIDPKAPKSMINLCKAYGTELVLVTETDENGGYQASRIKRVQELMSQIPGAYWPNQYDNAANPNYHYHATAAEILDLPIDLVCGTVSTGGHLSGIARNLRVTRPEIKTLGCDVNGSVVFGGQYKPYLLNGIGLSWQSSNTDVQLLDHWCKIEDNIAISTCHYLARKFGILLGGSGGLAVFAALAYLRQHSSQNALVIVADSGINYLHQFYDHQWIQEHQVQLVPEHEFIQHLQTVRFEPVVKTIDSPSDRL